MPVHHLSFGQKTNCTSRSVSAATGAAAAQPTAYLDRLAERQLIEEHDRIHKSSVTVVMATHDMNLAYSWADRVLVMDQVVCVMEGSPQDVFKEAGRLESFGLEQPMLPELWQALPEHVHRGTEPPCSISEFKLLPTGWNNGSKTSVILATA